MLKKSAKRFLALLCTISLIITSLFVVEAEDTAASDTEFAERETTELEYKMQSMIQDDYRVVTPLTFGQKDVNSAAANSPRDATISVNKLLFSVNMSADGYENFFYLSGNNSGTSLRVCKMDIINSTNRIYLYNFFDVSGVSKLHRGDESDTTGITYGSASYYTINPSNFGATSITSREFQLWITTEFVDMKSNGDVDEEYDDLKIVIWVDGIPCGDYYVPDCAKNTYYEHVQISQVPTLSSPIMELDHMGMVGGEYTSEEGGPHTSTLVANKNMNGTTFQTSVRFEEAGGTLYYGSDKVESAVRLTSTAEGIRVSYGDKELVVMNKDNVGIDVLNNNFDLKLTTKISGSDVNLDVGVENKQASFTLAGAEETLQACVGVKTEGNATVLVGDFADEDPEQITHDLDDGSYTITKRETMERLSVNGVSQDGDIELTVPGTYSIAVTENGKVSMIDVTIPDKFAEYDSTEIESKMQEMIDASYRVVTPMTFGVPDTNATGSTVTTTSPEDISIDKLLFSAVVKYGEVTTQRDNFNYLYRGGAAIQLPIIADTTDIRFYNYVNSKGRSVMYVGDTGETTVAYASYHALKKDIALGEGGKYRGNEVQIWITTEFETAPWLKDDAGDDLKIGIWFNGKLYNNEYFYVLDCKDLQYQGYVEIGSRNAISSTFIEPNDMGMVGGEYASVDGVFKTSDLVASKNMNKTTFQSSVRFEGEGGTLYYGSNGDAKAIQLTSTADGIQVKHGDKDLVLMNKQNVDIDVLNNNFDLKLTTRDSENNKVELDICVNDRHKTFELDCTTADLTACVGVKTIGDATVLVGDFADETPVELDWCLDEGKLYSVDKKASMTRMSVDGVDTVSELIDEPGTYSIVYVKSGKVYMQDAIAYRSYDLNDNNEMDIVDIVRMKKVASETTKEATINALSPAGRKAIDYDESTWTDDIAQKTLKAARQALVETVEIEVSTMELMDEESVYTYGFEFLGGTQVMPIGGFNGPVPASSITADIEVPNYISDTYFSMIEDCGVNLILHSDVFYDSNSKDINRILELGEQYGIGITVKDRRYEQLGNDLTVEKAAEYLSDYQSYKAFCGVYAVDEPTSTDYGFNETLDNTYPISNYAKRINTLEELGVWTYGNLLPCYDYKYGAQYEKYVREWLETCDVKMLMWDKYVYEKPGEEADYFYNMSLGRKLADEYKLPFWTYVQAGSQLEAGSNYTSANINVNFPKEGEFMWNVNTCLAYGAKGISYFPLIQPAYFAELKDETTDFSRNGLIGANGSKNIWWGFAQKANEQIAAIDDVLMNSVNKGVIITSDEAKADNTYSDYILDGTSWREMESIEGDVMVGCFNYQGKSAFYVVNYNREASQNITMKFFDNYQFRVTQNATTSRHRAGSLELSLKAGEGVLVVME